MRENTKSEVQHLTFNRFCFYRDTVLFVSVWQAIFVLCVFVCLQIWRHSPKLQYFRTVRAAGQLSCQHFWPGQSSRTCPQKAASGWVKGHRPVASTRAFSIFTCIFYMQWKHWSSHIYLSKSCRSKAGNHMTEQTPVCRFCPLRLELLFAYLKN